MASLPRQSFVGAVAIVVRVFIESADQHTHDRLQAAVEERISRAGGPPDGLMVHLGYPSGGDLALVDVWRSEDTFRTWWNDVLQPALAAEGLPAAEPEILPLWSLARP